MPVGVQLRIVIQCVRSPWIRPAVPPPVPVRKRKSDYHCCVPVLQRCYYIQYNKMKLCVCVWLARTRHVHQHFVRSHPTLFFSVRVDKQSSFPPSYHTYRHTQTHTLRAYVQITTTPVLPPPLVPRTTRLVLHDCSIKDYIDRDQKVFLSIYLQCPSTQRSNLLFKMYTHDASVKRIKTPQMTILSNKMFFFAEKISR